LLLGVDYLDDTTDSGFVVLGLARLRMSAEEASVARDDLADVRVVDAADANGPISLGVVRPPRSGIFPLRERCTTSVFLTTAFGSQRRQFGSRR
jgi:hypothetical protein